MLNMRTSYSLHCFLRKIPYTVEPRYNDISLCDASSITSDILWYQLILFGLNQLFYNDTKYPFVTLKLSSAVLTIKCYICFVSSSSCFI